jgi:hypothetical protein
VERRGEESRKRGLEELSVLNVAFSVTTLD